MTTDPTNDTTHEQLVTPSRAMKALAVCEMTSLVIALVTLLGCVVVLFVFVRGVIVEENPVKPPDVTGKPDDINKMSYFATSEPYRQQVRIGQRAAVLRSCGLLAGVAAMFLALTMFLLAVRTEAGVAPRDRTLAWSLTRMLPATVALVCAAALISFSAPEAGPAESPGPHAGSSYAVPPVVVQPVTAP
jgi:hypothetical protein